MGKLLIKLEDENYIPQQLCSINRFGEADDYDTCVEYCELNNCDCNKCVIQRCFNKLAEYENLEEQGKLLKLPCSVGNMVYTISRGEVLPLKVSKIEIFLLEGKETIQIECTNDVSYGCIHFLAKDLGKRVFLTKTEAEELLKIRKEG